MLIYVDRDNLTVTKNLSIASKHEQSLDRMFIAHLANISSTCDTQTNIRNAFTV